MSEDQGKITDIIEGLATAVITAYVRYIKEHRDMDNASVIAASALYVAVIVDSLSFDEDDPSQEDMMMMIADAAMRMLKEEDIIRPYVGKIVKTVVDAH